MCTQAQWQRRRGDQPQCCRGMLSWSSRLTRDSPQLGRLGRGIGIQCGQRRCHGNVVTLGQESTAQPQTFGELDGRRKQIIYTNLRVAPTRIGCWEGELFWGMGMGERKFEPADFVEVSRWTQSCPVVKEVKPWAEHVI